MNQATDETRQQKKRYLFSILFLIVLIAATITVLLTKYKFNDLLIAIRNVNKWYFCIGILMMLIYIFFEGAATKRIFHSMNQKISLRDNFVYSAIDYYFCSVTPSASGGQPMVAYYMHKDHISISHASLTLLINTALFKIVLLLLSIFSLIFSYSFIFTNPLIAVLFFVGFVINVGLIYLCFLAAFRRDKVESIGKRLIFLFAKWHFIKDPLKSLRRFFHKMEEYQEGAALIRKNPKDFFLAMVYNLVQRISFFSILYFVYLSFLPVYPEISGYCYFHLFSIQILVTLCVDSLPIPGGVGISEYLYFLLLSPIFTQNDTDLVGSALIVTRIMNFYFPLLFTGLITIIKQILSMRKTN